MTLQTVLAVDTWGSGFGLLDRQGNPVGIPVYYRDGLTPLIRSS